MSVFQFQRVDTGFFGKISLPGPRDLLYRANLYRTPGHCSLVFSVSLLAKIQPTNAVDLALREASEKLNQAIRERDGE